MANNNAIPCLKPGVALRELTAMVEHTVLLRRESKRDNRPCACLPHFQFKDEEMADKMVNVMLTTLHLTLGEKPAFVADLRGDGWKTGERKLVIMWGITPEEAEKTMKEMGL